MDCFVASLLAMTTEMTLVVIEGLIDAGPRLHHGFRLCRSRAVLRRDHEGARNLKVGRSDRWLGYGERADANHPDRVYIAIYRCAQPDEAISRHWCFKANSRSAVDAFWRAGIAAGGTDDGPPGLHHYHAANYGAFLRDPDGNKVEAVCHRAV